MSFRQATLFGNYNHFQGIHWLPNINQAQNIQLAGWHKRGGPSGSRPWVASWGQLRGDTACWNDSGSDLDFDDVKVRFTKLPGPRIQLIPHGRVAETLSPTDPEYVAQAIIQLASLGENSDHTKARLYLLDGYRAEHPDADQKLIALLREHGESMKEEKLQYQLRNVIEELSGRKA